jgi:hypothetical protein
MKNPLHMAMLKKLNEPPKKDGKKPVAPAKPIKKKPEPVEEETSCHRCGRDLVGEEKEYGTCDDCVKGDE